jgi:hypothetical protein
MELMPCPFTTAEPAVVAGLAWYFGGLIGQAIAVAAIVEVRKQII